MTLKVGKPVDIQTHKRFFRHQRGYAIGDLWDALVELITNADDSYGRLYNQKKRSRNGGVILIEHRERRGAPSELIIRDRAEGMDAADLEEKIVWRGGHTSGSGSRGYMGRGARDCLALGELIFESIKNERYYRCRVTARDQLVPEELGVRVHGKHRYRDQMGVPHGNGTSVTLVLNEEKHLHRIETLSENVPLLFTLRDIAAEDSDSRLLIRRFGGNEKPRQLVYRAPAGELLIDESFRVEGYPEAKARVRIWKTEEPLQEVGPRFERFGLLIKGERAIHECSLLADEFKRDHNARRYFGRIDCPYIDELMLEYEERDKQTMRHPPENPRLLIDPNRRSGLDRRHPFVPKLLQTPSEKLRRLLAQDREREKERRKQIANRETQARLKRLSKIASQFLNEQLEELEELGIGEAVDRNSLMKTGVLLYPTYLRVGVDNERSVTMYVKKSMLDNGGRPIRIETDSPEALEVVGAPFKLHAHKRRPDLLLGSFRIRGREVKDSVSITTDCDGLPSAEATVEVVQYAVEDRIFGEPLEFERDNYRVRTGSRKSLRLFARYPEVVAEPVTVHVYSNTPDNVAVRGKCTITPVAGSNYAEATVTIEGRRVQSKARIVAEVAGRTALTQVKVIEKREEPALPIEFDFSEEPFGNFRARWADHEGKPNLLLISVAHPSVSRYLGPASEDYPGQEKPWFRVLLAEIIAESVCRKALVLEAKARPWEFNWAEFQEDNVIADDVLAKLQQRMRKFVGDAHKVMLSDSEIKAAEAMS